MMEIESRISLQSLPDSEVFSPCSIEHQDVFMYEDDKQGPTCGREGRDSPTFLDISHSMKPSFTPIKTEPDTDTLMSWTQKHPEHWSQNEILDWIYFVASTIDVDPTTIRGEGFQNISGPELCRMTQDDFQKRDPVNGKCFYDMFRSLHKDAFFIEPECDYNYVYQQSEMKQEPKLTHCHYSSNQNNSESLSDTSENMDIYNKIHRNDSTGSDVMSDEEFHNLPVATGENDQRPLKKKSPAKRKHGEQTKPQNRGRKPGQISKGNHLWEFIRDLLKDSKYNPHLLRWEEKETGVFRFVQSEAVAQMWGRKKNNLGMTYEKLSRAMRFCRTAGYFAEVPKTGKFPKKLCFRFGAKAFGWKD